MNVFFELEFGKIIDIGNEFFNVFNADTVSDVMYDFNSLLEVAVSSNENSDGSAMKVVAIGSESSLKF